MSVFQINEKSHLQKSMFFDEPVDVQRFDMVKYAPIDRLTETQQSYFWQPTEISCDTDRLDYKNLPAHEKHIFVSNLRRQILLDSVQGRSPNLVLLPIVSLPEVEGFINTWCFMESIHSKSYTHIIRNVYPNPSVVFDEMTDIDEIVQCAADISKYYDELEDMNMIFNKYGYGTHVLNGETVVLDSYEHKKALWKCLNSINILEAIRFYVSFACTFAFGENKLMEGSAKIVRFICR